MTHGKANPGFIAHLVLDRLLRRQQAIFEYSTDPRCALRAQELHFEQAICLADGTCCEPGDRFLDLHLWNERIPRSGERTPTWRLRFCDRLDLSLRELARFLAEHKEHADIKAVRANMAFGAPQQTPQIVRISRRYGFEYIPAAEPHTVRQHLHRFGENILIFLITLAWGQTGLRLNSFWRGRTQVFISRAALEQRYGSVSWRRRGLSSGGSGARP
ncbi:MAG TPA: hypothetical protein VEK34_10870 [Methylocella sp.]|nr:hypothetical protein [Methylocella sp.]